MPEEILQITLRILKDIIDNSEETNSSYIYSSNFIFQKQQFETLKQYVNKFDIIYNDNKINKN